MRASGNAPNADAFVPGTLSPLDVLEALPGLLYIADAAGTPLYCSRQLLEYNGSTFESLRNGAWLSFTHPDDREETLRRWREATAAGQPYEFEQRVRHVSGEYRWLLTRANPLRDEHAQLVGWVGFSVEIERTRRAEAALRESEERFGVFMENLPAAAWIKDLQGRYVFANPEAVRAFAVTYEELYGATDYDVHPPEIAAQFAENDNAVIESATSVRTIETLPQDDGVHSSIVAKFPLMDADGRMTHVAGIAIDLTAQHAAEDSLRQSEARYRRLYEKAGASARAHADAERKLMLLVEATSQLIDPDGLDQVLSRVLSLSTRLIAADAYAVWRLDPETGTWSTLATQGLSDEYLRNTLIEVNEATPTMTATLAISDVTTEPVLEGRTAGYLTEGVRSLLAVPLRIGGENRGTLTFYFRSPHNAAPEEIRLAESLATIASAAISSSEMHGEQRRVNDELVDANRRLAFLSKASAALSAEFDAEPDVDADKPNALGALARLLVPAFADLCVIDVLESGQEPRRVEVVSDGGFDTATLARAHLRDWKTAPNTTRRIGDAILAGESVVVSDVTPEWIAACAPNDEQRQLIESLHTTSMIMTPLRARGQTIGTLTTVAAGSRRYDPSDRQLVEEVARRAAVALDNARLFATAQRTTHELRVANAAKDEFLGLVSHELKTPITTILGNAEVLERRHAELDDASRAGALADIRGEAERLHRIIDNLLVLARLEAGSQIEREPMLVRRVVDQIVASHHRSFPTRRITLNWTLEPTPVLGSPHYLDQVVRNFLSNAEKYSPPDRPIEIASSRDGDDLIVRVLDEGPGVGEGELDALFTPFYRSSTTERLAHGVGIGLAVCKRLIEAQGGRVWARRRSAEGGSEFGFTLPVADDE